MYRIKNLLKKGDNLLGEKGTFAEDTNPALTLLNMAKESAKYNIRMEQVNEYNKVCMFIFINDTINWC